MRKNWIWDDPQKLKAWLDILMEANHAERKVNLGNEIIPCKRGQSINSILTWGKRWSWDRSKVRRFFNCLQNDHMIELKTTNRTTILTVSNYETYQNGKPSNEHQKNIKRTSNEHQTNINKELKELEELKEGLPFQSNDFQQAWNDWIAYRKQLKKPVTERAVSRHLKLLKKMSEPDAIECIDLSISNGWTGLFELKQKNKINKEMSKAERDKWNRTL